VNSTPPEAEAPQKPFGPFLIPQDHPILDAGWRCRDCRQPVKKLVKPMLGLYIMHFYACRCGCVAVWADEKQPCGAKHWRQNMRLARRTRAEIMIFNGNKPLPPGWQGLN
jgi:hypothetical protein